MPTNSGNISKYYCMKESFTPTNITRSLNNSTAQVDPAIIVWPYMAGVLCSVAAVLNFSALFVIFKFPVLFKGAGFLIAHLLACNAMECLTGIPMLINRVAKAPYIQMDCGICRYQHGFYITFNNLANWSEALLGLNRLAAIILPLQFHTVNRNLIQLPALLACWVLTLVYTVPPTADILGIYRLSETGTCAIMSQTAVTRVLYSLNAYCPTVLIAAAAFVITTKFARDVKMRRMVHVVSGEQEARRPPPLVSPVVVMSERQRRITKMLVMSFCLSLTCQTPVYILVSTGYNASNPIITVYLNLLTMVHYAATPVVFFTMNKDYRDKVGVIWAGLGGTTVAVGPMEDVTAIGNRGRVRPIG
ncbi:hypothetical protein BV898_02379 [Hypsibius exemplaris]|uniref:G-protein coupled receptors family 1 profile domain-containing protein n=1 Tax=Hypsibius exemplaris TaxID=2072580 RepID=A0A1W0X7V9_HYPEX|nr:hypothetical protein BV898_02379 [Hypsibius exemplaris]